VAGGGACGWPKESAAYGIAEAALSANFGQRDTPLFSSMPPQISLERLEFGLIAHHLCRMVNRKHYSG
jgi:hypothetical protein